MRPRASVPAAVTTAIAAALALASTPAWAAPATVVVDSHDFAPNAVTVNTGEAVTWDVRESGHNIDVWDGPEKFKSTSGKDAAGTQFTHTFTKAGTYQYICDYHSGMKGTVTVQQAPASPTPTPSGSSPQPTTGTTAPSNTSTGTSAGANPVAPSGSLGAIDAAAPSVRSLGVKHGRLALRLSEDSRLVVRYVRAGAHGHHVYKRIVKAHKGTVRLSLRRWMKAGRYRVHIMAFDASGNASRPVRLKTAIR
jgi:plastocyanin